MNGFLVSKRKTFELVVLFFLDLLFYFLWDDVNFVILFSLGFIWNWVASQEPEILIQNNQRYKFSTMKTVFNLQNLFLKPFKTMPEPVQIFVKILPAGIFWFMVILFNDSQIPWWAVFLGSLTLELLLLENKILKPKSSPP